MLNANKGGWKPAHVLILVAIVLIFVFFAFYANQFLTTSLEIDLHNRKIKIDTNKNSSLLNVKASNQDLIVDNFKGFSIKKLDDKEWSRQTIKGLDELLKIKGIALSNDAIENQKYMLNSHPLGRMLEQVEVLRFVNGSLLNVEIREDSTNPFIAEVLLKIEKSHPVFFKKMSAKEARNYKYSIVKSMVGFNELNFKNELNIYFYDKKYLQNIMYRPSLAAFSVFVLQSIGGTVDQLAANSTSVLAGGTTGIDNVLLNGKKGSFRTDRFWMITENQNYFYVVEIGFSPQTQSSMKIWSSLDDTLKSFKVIN